MSVEALPIAQRRSFPVGIRTSSEALPELDHFFSRREVSLMTGLGKTALYSRISRGEFPKPIRLSKSKVVWSGSDIAKWQRDMRRSVMPSAQDELRNSQP